MQSMRIVDVAALLARFHAEHPAVEIHLRPAIGGSAALADDVRQGGLDIAFVSLPDLAPNGLMATVLASEPFVVVGTPGSLPANRAPVPLGDLQHATFVDFPIGWGTRTAVDEAFAAAGLQRMVTIEVADVSTFTDLVRAGLGLGLLPRSLVPSDRRLSTKRVLPSPSWNVMMVRSDSRTPTAAAAAFAQLVLASEGGS